MEKLILAFMAADCLRNRGKLIRVFQTCLRFAFSEERYAALFDFIQNCKVPSRSSISRHQLTLHAGWFLYLRSQYSELLKESLVWSLLIDASPQGGREWSMMTGTFVSKQQVGKALLMFHDLMRAGENRPSELHQEQWRAHIARECDLIQELSAELIKPDFPAGLLGSKRTSMPHKMHCLLHCLRLICPNWSDVCQMTRSCTAITADMGTERVLPRFPVTSIKDMFAWDFPQHGGDGFVVEDDTVQVQARVDMHELEIDFSHTVYVPGPLHILHNATKDLSSVMEWFSDYLQQLSQICRLLRRPFLRERLVETCFVDSHARHLKHMFNDPVLNELSVYEGRWGTIAAATTGLGKFEGALRLAWNLGKFNFHQNVDQAKDDTFPGESLDLNQVDVAIRSQKFWGYRLMVDKLAAVLDHGINWCEACPCHSGQFTGTYARRKQLFKAMYNSKPCPMLGRRSVEFATGAFFTVFDNLFAESLASLDIDCGRNLAGADRQLIVEDFEKARGHTKFIFKLRLSCWEELPLKLFGLGSHDIQVAHSTATQCLAMFDACTDKSLLHPLCHKFLGDAGSSLRKDLISFIQGRAMSELPSLCAEVGAFVFVRTVERSVEAMHARTQRDVRGATHHSPAYVALKHSLPFIEHEMSRKPQCLKTMAELCDVVDTPCKAAQALGLSLHPAFVKLLEQHGKRRTVNRKEWKNIVAMVYHGDRTTLFQAFNIKAQPGDGMHVEKPTTLNIMDGIDDGMESMMLRLGCQHLAQTWSNDHSGMFRLRIDGEHEAVKPMNTLLTSAISTVRMDVLAVHPDLLEDDGDATPIVSPADLVQDLTLVPDRGGIEAPTYSRALPQSLRIKHPALDKYVFFKILRPRIPKPAPKHTPSMALPITCHSVVSVDTARQTFVLAAESDISLCESSILLPTALALGQLQSLVALTSSPGLKYHIDLIMPKAHAAHAPALLQSMAHAGAKEGQGEFVLLASAVDYVPSMAVLVFLQREGLVECVQREDQQSKWRFTAVGVSKLIVGYEITGESKHVLDRGLSLELEDCTTYQLLCRLREQNWVFQSLPKKRIERRALTAQYEGGEKVWTANPSKLSHHYLIALLSHPQHKRPVPWGKCDRFYLGLLIGTPYVPKSKMAISADFDPARPLVALMDKPRAARGQHANRGRGGRRVHVHVAEHLEDQGEQSDGESEQPDPENNRNRLHDVSSASSGEHSSKNSTSSGSSSSSSSSSSDSDGDGDKTAGPALAGGDDAGVVPAPASPHPSVVPGSVASSTGGRGRFRDHWGSYFTITMKGERGWECKCRLPHHPAEKKVTTCSRTRLTHQTVPIDLVVRRLKWWALKGAALPDKAMHQN
jgi:hypothetical protein